VQTFDPYRACGGEKETAARFVPGDDPADAREVAAVADGGRDRPEVCGGDD